MGLHKYNPYTDQFTVYQQDHLPGSLSHSSVFSVYIDAQETIWVGTYYGGVNYFNAEGKYSLIIRITLCGRNA